MDTNIHIIYVDTNMDDVFLETDTNSGNCKKNRILLSLLHK